MVLVVTMTRKLKNYARVNDMNIRHDINTDDIVTGLYQNINQYKGLFEAQKLLYKENYHPSNLDKNGEPMPTPHEKNKEFEQMYLIRFNMESTYYSTVRIVEIEGYFSDGCKKLLAVGVKDKKEKAFMLVYGERDDDTVVDGDGTGLFGTYEAAKKWFMGGGR